MSVPKTGRPNVYLSPEQVCELVPGLTPANLQELRKRGKGPAYFKPTGAKGRVVIYAEADVRAWVEASRTNTTEQS
ncbi:helix-turn-helix transcriptional regulator [Microbacterium sp. NPDC090225]|uniref:helix-turn-helix transcriptional regulator n=1 Tax=Microbacterium sp. NPDC090225 TaxID=3364207 RepID=UPI003803BD78